SSPQNQPKSDAESVRDVSASVPRRQFLKRSGAATAGTILAWHGSKVDVYAVTSCPGDSYEKSVYKKWHTASGVGDSKNAARQDAQELLNYQLNQRGGTASLQDRYNNMSQGPVGISSEVICGEAPTSGDPQYDESGWSYDDEEPYKDDDGDWVFESSATKSC